MFTDKLRMIAMTVGGAIGYVSYEETQTILDKYFKAFPKLKEAMGVKKEAKVYIYYCPETDEIFLSIFNKKKLKIPAGVYYKVGDF